MVLLQMCIEFFKTGLFAIGGGLATLPFLYEMAENYPWFTEAELLDMIAISESTPGPIGVNMATYAGYNVAGIPGALIATFSLIAPSIIIITIISKFLSQFSSNQYVKDAFYGLKPAVTALIAAACYQLMQTSLFTFDAFAATRNITDIVDTKSIILFGLLFYLYNKFNKHPVFYLAGAAAAGIIFKF